MDIIYSQENKVELLKEICSGSYGTVYSGILNDNIIVAIKKQKRNDTVFNEWKYLTSFNSEFIIKGLLTFYYGRRNYMIFEKADSDLQQYIKEYGPIEDKKLFAVMSYQIIKGVSELHEKDLIHRDIKPSNILVCGRTMKLCDFGFVIESNLRPRERLGTRTTMAPEVLLQEEYDISADIWSLGTVLYYIRTGNNAFKTGDTIHVTLMDMVCKVVFTGPIEKTIKETYRIYGLPYAKYTKLFENSIVYYRHQQIILSCLQPDASKRPTAEALLQHIVFKDLREEDFQRIPLYIPKAE